VLAPKVRVNCLAPGYVETEWHVKGSDAAHAAKSRDAMAAKAALKRVVMPDEVAQMAYTLLTQATGMTGELICIDGGVHLA
jgi:3-oxoacyl-[acyl-carrier protein] reductase